MNIKPIEEGTSRLTFGLSKHQLVWILMRKDCSRTATAHLLQFLSENLWDLCIKADLREALLILRQQHGLPRAWPAHAGHFSQAGWVKVPVLLLWAHPARRHRKRVWDVEASNRSEIPCVTGDRAAWPPLPLPKGHVCDYDVNGASPYG